MQPTAFVWLEPRATQRTCPLSIRHTQTDLSYRQMTHPCHLYDLFIEYVLKCGAETGLHMSQLSLFPYSLV